MISCSNHKKQRGHGSARTAPKHIVIIEVPRVVSTSSIGTIVGLEILGNCPISRLDIGINEVDLRTVELLGFISPCLYSWDKIEKYVSYLEVYWS